MKTCLVVDDSRVARKVARHILEALDFQVTEASDGSEALTACETSVPDVILLDWNMPVMNGIDFLRALGPRTAAARSKVVFCTTENGTAYIRAAMAAGADGYVMKPLDREALVGKLRVVGIA